MRAVVTSGATWARKVMRRIRRTQDLWVERQWEHDRVAAGSTLSDAELTALLRRMSGRTFSEYCEVQRLDPAPRSFVPADRDGVVRQLREQFADHVAHIIAAADRSMAGTFDVLGSGPVNMARSRLSGGKLDWRRDPITGRRFPAGVSQWRALVPGTYADVGGDIKGPWEIGRCQHLPTWGQAYWLTGDQKYAQAFAATIADFIRQNPAGFGVQWGCAMDVGLRVVSWLLALDLFRGSPALTDGWWRMFLRSLVEHGRFIAANLEFGTIESRVATSNHYLADVFALYWLATTHPDLDSNVVWRGLSEHALEREIRVQLNADGSSFESSVPYHRLVTEMFLSAYALSLRHGRRFSEEYSTRLMRALAFIRAIRQPGGRVPQVGDADNGRAHILSEYGRWNQESMDHVLVAGAQVFNWPSLLDGIDPSAQVERLFWGIPDQGDAIEVPPQSNPTLFPDFGLAVVRTADVTAVLTNGPVGTSGFGNHKHCDQLAVEIVVGDQPLFVDGGTYCYTSDPSARNHFRGTASHNTVMVAATEQHEFKPEWLFRMFQTGTTSLETGVDAGQQWIRGVHTAYERLTPAVIHRRTVSVTEVGTVTIDDVVDGGEGHPCRWHFLVHPSVSVALEGHTAVLSWTNGTARFELPTSLNARIENGWYSRAYGVRAAAQTLVCEAAHGVREARFELTRVST
jgi:hypothetical protein